MSLHCFVMVFATAGAVTQQLGIEGVGQQALLLC